jgi:hypothetical protein
MEENGRRGVRSIVVVATLASERCDFFLTFFILCKISSSSHRRPLIPSAAPRHLRPLVADAPRGGLLQRVGFA